MDQSRDARINFKRAQDECELIIAWDSRVLSPDQYARLVKCIGDMIRASGGDGIQRVGSSSMQITLTGDCGEIVHDDVIREGHDVRADRKNER